MKEPIYTLKNLSVSYKEIKALNINKFELHRGAMYLFTGFIGSGKSTLMKVLSKTHAIDQGEVLYESENITQIKKSKYNKEVVYLPQNNSRPWFGGTVKNYMLDKIKSNFRGDNYTSVFNKICNSMKISDFILNKGINSLSEGEYRWVQLAISIALDSKVLIIDYIDKSLDSNRKVILNRVLKRKTSYDGVTIIASTYNPDYFKMSASVIIKMDKGRITQVRSSSNKSK